MFEVAKLSGIRMSSMCKDPILQYKLLIEKLHVKNNWIPGIVQIANKGLLFSNYKNMTLKYSAEDFNYMPQSFLLPGDYEELRDAWDTSSAWIFKPTQV